MRLLDSDYLITCWIIFEDAMSISCLKENTYKKVILDKMSGLRLFSKLTMYKSNYGAVIFEAIEATGRRLMGKKYIHFITTYSSILL